MVCFVRPSASVWPLPRGLYGIYQDFLTKIREKVGDVAYWDQYFKPVLGALAVARAPLLEGQISDFSGVGRSTVGTVLTQVKQFPEPMGPEEARRWVVYHPSFGEYLVSDKNPDTISGREAHGRIVDHCRGKAITWVEVDWSRCDVYGLRYLAMHLGEAARGPKSPIQQEWTAQLHGPVQDPAFGNARLAQLGQPSLLLADLQAAVEIALQADDLAQTWEHIKH